MRTALLSLTIIVLTCALARADVLEFPLPNMTGGFSTYQDSILYTGDTLEISAVKLVVRAVIDDLGLQMCPYVPNIPAEICTLGFHYQGAVWKNQHTDAAYGPKGYCERTRTGECEEKAEILCCVVPVGISCAEVTLTGITLLIESSDEVDVEQEPWGRIKKRRLHE